MEHSIPEAFAERIRQEHADSDLFLAAIDSEPSLSVRLNPAKHCSLSGLPMAEPVAWSGGVGFYLSSRPQFTLMPELHAGAFYVQEASSMYIEHILEFVSEELPDSPQCLDLCAAPGGKSTLLMSFLQRHKGGRGLVVANEVVRQRAWVLRENIAKWGFPGAVVTNSEPLAIARCGMSFDLALVDAPCSGEGMFRKDDGARVEWSVQAAAECARRQREILSDMWNALRPGGFLIYSTCTFNPDENERNMEWLTSEFCAEPVAVPLVEGQGVQVVPFEGGEGYAFYPHKVRGEGFFVCLLRKPKSGTESRLKTARALRLETTELGSEYVDGLQTYLYDDQVFALPADVQLQQVALALPLKPLLVGTPVCSLLTKGRPEGRRQSKGNESREGGKNSKAVVVPTPELPLSCSFRKGSMPVVEVDKLTALKFLHGDTDLQLPPNGGKAEWVVVSYEGLPLGLVKQIGQRLNNYYPKEWRIRMQPLV